MARREPRGTQEGTRGERLTMARGAARVAALVAAVSACNPPGDKAVSPPPKGTHVATPPVADAGVVLPPPAQLAALPGTAWITPAQPFRLPRRANAIAIDGDTLVVAGYHGWIARIDLHTGAVLHEHFNDELSFFGLLQLDSREWVAVGTELDHGFAVTFDAETLTATPVPLATKPVRDSAYHAGAARMPDGSVVLGLPGLPLATYDPVTWQVRQQIDPNLDWTSVAVRDDHVIGIKTSSTEFDLASGTSHEIGYGHVIAGGPYVATVGYGTSVTVLDATWQHVVELPGAKGGAAFDPEAKRLVMVSEGAAVIHDLPSGRELARYALGHAAEQSSVEMAMNGHYVVVLADTMLRVVDLRTGIVSPEGEAPFGSILGLQIAPDGTMLVEHLGMSRFADGKLVAALGEHVRWLDGPRGEVNRVGMLTEDEPPTATLRATDTGKQLGQWTVPQSAYAGSFGSDGTVVIEGAEDFGIDKHIPQRLLRAAGKKLVPIVSLASEVMVDAIDVDTGIAMIELNGTVRALGLRDGKPKGPAIPSPACDYATVSIERRGTWVLVYQERDAFLVEYKTGRVVATLHTDHMINDAAFLPGHRELLLVIGSQLASWIPAAGELQTIEMGFPATLGISADAKWLALGYGTGQVSLGDLATVRAAMTPAHVAPATVPAKCPGGDPFTIAPDE
jgi:hypothetical protein